MTPLNDLYNIYRAAIKRLKNAGCDSPEFDAQQLVDYCLGYNKTQLLLNSKAAVDEVKLMFFEECLRRRESREPLQYIIGMWDFHKFRFKTKPGVLIPRPETELLPEFAVESLRRIPGYTVFDLCCGTGCVGLTVAKLFPNIRVFCIDISDDAIALANENKEMLYVPNAFVVKGDVFEGFEALKLPRPDMILSNPPYIPTEEIKTLQPEIAFEPELALDGGEDGLVFYRAIAEKWFPYLNEGGSLALECGEGQMAPILRMFVDSASDAGVIRDAAGTDRVAVLRR